MSPTDWRANQLADIMAKSAAAEDPRRVQAKRAIDSAQAALVHSAVALGALTYAANNVPEVVQCSGGSTKTLLRRDSTALPPCSSSIPMVRAIL